MRLMILDVVVDSNGRDSDGLLKNGQDLKSRRGFGLKETLEAGMEREASCKKLGYLWLKIRSYWHMASGE